MVVLALVGLVGVSAEEVPGMTVSEQPFVFNRTYKITLLWTFHMFCLG